jgi:alginate O-acetyltransferase complex protein AlgI
MQFNSYEFIFMFLPIIFFGYFFLASRRLITGAKVWLVGGSLLFYSWWNPIYLPLILMSIFFNYATGTGLGKSFAGNDRHSKTKPRLSRKSLLTTGILFNISLLAYFKYTDFFIKNINTVFGLDVPLQHIVLPLAISFFTFQQIAYLVDSYRGETKEYDLLNYMLFVTFFPQLIAGPIVHHKEMMPQFLKNRNYVKHYRNIALGLFIFSIGLFKKVVIADTFAHWANAGFDGNTTLLFFQAWSVSLSYTFQLYFDFSGYVDMAIGAALLFNIRLPINFNSPYKAVSIQDFWRRWHITLSRFLRDYVYIPLGGSRKGQYSTYANLFATFLIGGIWHGASWMFVIWGALHGVALIIHRVWKELDLRMWNWLSWLVTFNFINVTWVFFRAENIESAQNVLRGLIDYKSAFESNLADYPTSSLAWLGTGADYFSNYFPASLVVSMNSFFMIIFAFVVISFKNTSQISGDAHRLERSNVISFPKLIYASLLFISAALIMLSTSSTIFLYFNF